MSRSPYLASLASVLAVAAGLAAVAAFGLRAAPEPAEPRPGPSEASPGPATVAASSAEPASTPEPPPPSTPPPAPAVPEPDPSALAAARAELAAARAELEAARADRARAEARAEEADRALRDAEAGRDRRLADAASLRLRLEAPSARLARARQRGEALRAEALRLDAELAGLARVDRPRPRPLVDKSPVARPPDGDESHFELNRGRIAFINLDALLDHVRTDARIQLRMARSPRRVSGTVGPVGEFSLAYEMAPDSLEVLGGSLGGVSASYSLTGWEILPRSELRGESLAEALQPTSRFVQAVQRLDPGRDAITFWVYPDSFALYRDLRDRLHALGFLVSARPLPRGMGIRGSPAGSVSAGQ
jgi:hypothetical protein